MWAVISSLEVGLANRKGDAVSRCRPEHCVALVFSSQRALRFVRNALLKCLLQRFLHFFLEKYKRRVCDADKWEFVNGWYILVIISDLMTVVGSVLKMEIQVKVRGNPF